MAKEKNLLSPLSILMLVILLAAAATWLIPAGRYDRLSYTGVATFEYSTADTSFSIPLNQATLDSLHINIPLAGFTSGGIKKPVSVPGTYKKSASSRQGILAVLQAPVKGVHESIDVIFFIVVIGGFMQVFTETGAMVKGISTLSANMKGRESWLIIILTFLFSFGGSSFGMAEEGLVFYPLLVPIFLAAGYDLLVPVAVIFAGTQMGTLSSFSNPFSTIIASNAAGVSWTDGITERLIMFVLTSAVLIWYIVRYANKVKKDPTASLVMKLQGPVQTSYMQLPATGEVRALDSRAKILLALFFATFLTMITGVVFFEWWLLEMTTLFFAAAIVFAIVVRLKENLFISQFIDGARSLLGVALIIGTARGVTIILNDGNISDSIIYSAAGFASNMPPYLFIIAMLFMYIVFTLFISSSSGMAVLTMPIMGSLAILLNVPGREIVNAYLFGMGIMGFLTPTGLILPSLALTQLSLKTWWHFIYPLMLILIAVCTTCLVVGIYIK